MDRRGSASPQKQEGEAAPVPEWADGDRAWFGYNGTAALVTLSDKDGDGHLWFRNPDKSKHWMPVSIFADALTREGADDAEEDDGD